ncbi:MAG TPA: divalent-cation tolerance protein CutA [Dehalococcoidia bacterium]|nr:divalent-cation tolerance protein CutA [Dehalococcoidia bacterium]
MESSNYIVLLITTGSVQEAQQIAKLLLEQRKIACANIIPKVDSHFWWQDKLDSAEESLLIAKTKASLLPEIITLVKEIHSYQVPEIIALPIIGGSQDYLEWIEKSVS